MTSLGELAKSSETVTDPKRSETTMPAHSSAGKSEQSLMEHSAILEKGKLRSANDTDDDDDCVPSFSRDVANRNLANATLYNASLVQRYREEGKILESGLPIINYVHIAKTGGDSFGLSASSLGQYGFGSFNAQYQVPAVQSLSAMQQGCLIEQSPSIDLDYDFAKHLYGESEVFCGIRDPFERAISGACHLGQYVPGFKDKPVEYVMRSFLESYTSGDRHIGACFWIPQVDYLKGEFGCTRFIDFDNIEAEFNELMEEKGFSEIKLMGLDDPFAAHQCSKSCHITKDDLSAEMRNLLETVYAEDIEFHKEFKHNRTITSST